MIREGIDVSKWQSGKMNYVAAKKAGIEFVFIRIGCGKTKDKFFEQDYAAAKAAGLKVGAYFYTVGKVETDSTADATRVLGWLDNRKLDFPVAYDVEDNKQRGTGRKKINSQMYNAFKDKIEEGGIYDAILYTGEYFFNNFFDKAIVADDLWIAKYSSKMPQVGRQVAIWQFSSDEIDTTYWKGKLDRNRMYIDSFQGSRTPQKTTTDNPYPVPTRNLKRTLIMMKGNDVRWLQTELSNRGYNIAIDGVFGDETKRCVLDFQKENGLLVDGIVGSATRYALCN